MAQALKDKAFSVAVDRDMRQELAELAESEDRSIAAVLRRAIRRELAEARKQDQRLKNGSRRKLAAVA